MKRAGEGKSRRRSRRDQDTRLEDEVLDDFYKLPGSPFGASQGLKHDQSLFLEAVKCCSINRVRTFLDQGLDPTFTILPDRETPLHVAVREWNPENPASEKIVRQLLFFGCDPNALDKDGNTPLHIACKKNIGSNHGCVEMLLQAGADVNMTNHWYQETPLMIVCKSWEPRLDTVRLMVDNGAVTSLVNYHAQNVLHLVCCSDLCRPCDFVERSKIVRFLLEQGVSCNQKDSNGKTPLCYELLRLVYFFHTSDDTRGSQRHTLYRNAVKVALVLVSGGALSNFQAHENDFKALITTMMYVKRARHIILLFLLSIRNLLPLSDFHSILEWMRGSDHSADSHSSGLSNYLSSNVSYSAMTGMNFDGSGDLDDDDDDDDDDDELDVDDDDFLDDSNTNTNTAAVLIGNDDGGDGDNSDISLVSAAVLKALPRNVGGGDKSDRGGGGGGGDSVTQGGTGNSDIGSSDSSSSGPGDDISIRTDERVSVSNNITTTSTTTSTNYHHSNMSRINSNSSSNNSNNNNNNHHHQHHHHHHHPNHHRRGRHLHYEDRVRWSCPPSLLSLSRVVIRTCLGGRVRQLSPLLDTLPRKHQDYLKSIP